MSSDGQDRTQRFKNLDRQSMTALIELLPELEDLENAIVNGKMYDQESLSHRMYRLLYQEGWIQMFQWSAWAHGEEGQRLFNTESGIEHANLDQVVKMITAIVRADRFQQNLYDNSIHNGLFLRIVRRVEYLYRKLEETGE